MCSVVCLTILAAAFRIPHAAAQPPLPPETPDGLAGLELFAGRCANCHGETGRGDGELIRQSGGTPPKAFDETYIRAAVPSAIFDQITNGEATAGMPPFGPASSNPIDEQGRWNLAAAVYSLATPADSIDAGQTLYETQCAACHGDAGAGDGPDATDPPPTDLRDAAYWFARSNEVVFSGLTAPSPAHTFELAGDDLWRVIDFARTFSYAYADPAQLNAPIPAGRIAGTLSNGTNGERLAGQEVNLLAFTPELAQTLDLTATTDANGDFEFEVNDTLPDWVFIVSAGLDGIVFNSPVGQLSRNEPLLELPVTVYESTRDGSAVHIGQLHTVVEFTGDRVRLSQLYVFDNEGNAVYVGPSGDPAEGVVEIAVPEGAENVGFQRSFGTLDSFVPASDIIETSGSYADPLPLKPGLGASGLLVQYELPYTSGMTIAHPVFHNTRTSTLVLPDTGVRVTNSPWVEQRPQSFDQSERFLRYSGPGIAAGGVSAIELSGRPSIVTGATGAAVVNRDATAELLIGGGVLLLVAVGGIFVWRSWRAKDSAAATAVRLGESERDSLIRAIADLDDAFEIGDLAEDTYLARRANLKQRLAAVWED